MAEEVFNGKIISDADVSLPKLEDFYYNSLTPFEECDALFDTNGYFYVETPPGGEDAVGFLDDDDSVFTMKCTPAAFDLSSKAMYTGATDSDTLLFNIADSTNIVIKGDKCSDAQYAKNKKYYDELVARAHYTKNGKYETNAEYRYKLRLQLMALSTPDIDHFSIEVMPEARVTTISYKTLKSYSENYFCKYVPEFVDITNTDRTRTFKINSFSNFATRNDVQSVEYVREYKDDDQVTVCVKDTSTIAGLEVSGRCVQCWKVDSSEFSGTVTNGNLYVLVNKKGVDLEGVRTVAYQIRDKVYNLIKGAKDIRVVVPSSVSQADAAQYYQYANTYTSPKSTLLEIIEASIGEEFNAYRNSSWYQFTGWSMGGTDSFGRLIGVIFIKTTVDGVERWVNLNKYILANYYDVVQNKTAGSTDSNGTDIYIAQGPSILNPLSYKFSLANVQDLMTKKQLNEAQQNDRRIELQKQVFTKAGYTLCSDEDDLYNNTVSIGDVSLFIPPTQIKVQRSTQTERIPIMRAKGAMAKQVEKVENHLELSIYFNNSEGINGYPIETDLWTKREKENNGSYNISKSSEAFAKNEVLDDDGNKDNGLRTYYMNGIRALIAEFKFCPFLPIVNKYINETLDIHAIAFEQILVKTVPGFPKLLVANLVLKEFDYRVYMQQLPDAYMDFSKNKMINPFAQSFNYDLLRYYYQRPILYGNKIAAKLASGKTKITVNKQEQDVKYTFNTPYFIKDTVFNNRTCLMPCNFEDPTISIYTANEAYLAKLRDLKKAIMRKRLGYTLTENYNSVGSANDYIPSTNQIKIANDVAQLYSSLKTIYDKYTDIQRQISIALVNQSNNVNDSKSADENNKIEFNNQTYANLRELQYKVLVMPLYKELKALKNIKKYNSDENLVKDVYPVVEYLTGRNYTSSNTYSQTKLEEENGYFIVKKNEKEKIVFDPTIYVELDMSYASDLAEILEMTQQADIGYSSTSSETKSDVDKYAITSADRLSKVVKVRLGDLTKLFTNNNGIIFSDYYSVKPTEDTAVTQYDVDLDLYNGNSNYKVYSKAANCWRTEYDKIFVDYCYQNQSNFNNANQDALDLKEAIDYENVKSIKFDKVLSNALVMDFESGVNNNFARISTQLSEGYASQYMGSSDNYISWHLRINTGAGQTDEEKTNLNIVKTLQNLPKFEAKCMRLYHDVLPCFPIRIDSEFTRMLGIFEVSIEDVQVLTVPNYPGLYEVTVRAISVDRTLRNRESLKSVDQLKDDGVEIIGEVTNQTTINNSGVKQGEMRTKINQTTTAQLQKRLARSELYPDLELPKLAELENLGFRFIRYSHKEREADVLFVDPDFYMYYPKVIFADIMRRTLENMYGTRWTNGDNKLKDSERIELQAADLTGAKVAFKDYNNNINPNRANSEFMSQFKDVASQHIAEQKIIENQDNQRKLIEHVPALMIGEKRHWDISTNITCAFKESYIHKLEELLKDKEKAKSIIDADDYEALVKLNKQFEGIYSDKTDADTDGDTTNQTAAKSSLKERIENARNYLATRIVGKALGSFSEESGATTGPTTTIQADIYTYLNDTYTEVGDGTYQDLFSELYINLNLTSDQQTKLFQTISNIMCAIKSVRTAQYEYNASISDTNWKGIEKYTNTFTHTELDNGILTRVTGGNKTKAERSNIDTSKWIFSGVFGIKKYKYEEIAKLLKSDELDQLKEYTKSNDEAYQEMTNRYYLLHPAFRTKEILSLGHDDYNKKLDEIMVKCKYNTYYAEDVALGILIWWLIRCYDEGVFPSLCFDIWRARTLQSNTASEKIKALLEQYNNGQDVFIDTTTLKNLSEYIQNNAKAIDAGKFFIAALFMLTDKPLNDSNNLFRKIKSYDYEYLDKYRNECVNQLGTAKQIDVTDEMNMHRRFLLALCGYGEITGTEFVGRSTGVTPAAQFISRYNTKLALAACNNPDQYLPDSMYDMLRSDYRGRMLRAFPTFYVMFIDEGKEIGLWKLHDNFYSMNGINEITITKSRKFPADTCSLVLSNNYSTFTMDDEDGYINYMGEFFKEIYDSIFNQRKVAMNAEKKRLMASWVNKAKLSPGIRIHVRVGYGSDARALSSVFNGVIAEVEPNAKAIKVVAQGNGIELTHLFMFNREADEAKFIDTAGDAIVNTNSNGDAPDRILCSFLLLKGGFLNKYLQGKYSKDQFLFKHGEYHWDSDFLYGLSSFLAGMQKSNYFGITHFGDPDYIDVFPEGEICQNIYSIDRFPAMSGARMNAPSVNVTTANNNVVDDEAYNATASSDDDKITSPLISFDAHGKSFWDAMNICQSVAPDYICGIAPFGMRDTIFYGKPHYYCAYDYADVNGVKIEKRKPFQQIHMYSSDNDIIADNIYATNKTIKTCATGLYQEQYGNKNNNALDVGPLFVDKDIYPENQKSYIFDTRLLFKPGDKKYTGLTYTKAKDRADTGSFADLPSNVLRNIGTKFSPVKPFSQITSFIEETNEYTEPKYSTHKKIAWCATANALKNSMKEMYQGDLCIIGDPSVKPYDRIIIHDTYNDLRGQVLVRDVSHVLSLQSGFSTTMNVDLISVVDDREEMMKQMMFINYWSFAAHCTAFYGASRLGIVARRSLLEATDKLFTAAESEANTLKKFCEEALTSGLTSTEDKEAFKVLDELTQYDKDLAAAKAAGKSETEIKALEKAAVERMNKLSIAKDIKSITEAKALDLGKVGKLKTYCEEAGIALDSSKLPEIKNTLLEKANKFIDGKVKWIEKFRNVQCKILDPSQWLAIFADPTTKEAMTEAVKTTGEVTTRTASKAVNVWKASAKKLAPIRALILGGGDASLKGLLAFAGGPWGIALSIAYDTVLWAGVEFIGHSISNYLYYNIANHQVLRVYPLQKWGMAYTSGLEGSMGLVYGSPTWNKNSPIEKFITKICSVNNDDRWLTKGLKAIFFNDDIYNAAAKYRRDNDFFRPIGNNSVNDEMKMESSVFGVAHRKKINNMRTILALSMQERVSSADFTKDKVENRKEEFNLFKASLVKTRPKSLDEFLSDQKHFDLFPVLDSAILKNYNQNMNGFFQVSHLLTDSSTASSSSNSSTSYKRQLAFKRDKSGKNIPVSYIEETTTSDDGSQIVYDLPYLTQDARTVLTIIVDKAYNRLKSGTGNDESKTAKALSGKHVILTSALRIYKDKSEDDDDQDFAGGAGNTFELKSTGTEDYFLYNLAEEMRQETEKEVSNSIGKYGQCCFDIRKSSRKNHVVIEMKVLKPVTEKDKTSTNTTDTTTSTNVDDSTTNDKNGNDVSVE